jgi:hypothetical protein
VGQRLGAGGSYIALSPLRLPKVKITYEKSLTDGNGPHQLLQFHQTNPNISYYCGPTTIAFYPEKEVCYDDVFHTCFYQILIPQL